MCKRDESEDGETGAWVGLKVSFSSGGITFRRQWLVRQVIVGNRTAETEFSHIVSSSLSHRLQAETWIRSHHPHVVYGHHQQSEVQLRLILNSYSMPPLPVHTVGLESETICCSWHPIA